MGGNILRLHQPSNMESGRCEPIHYMIQHASTFA